jgi:HEAT repeat protein
MQFVFDLVNWLGPAALIFEAIVATGVAVALLLTFILLRRARRRRYFRLRDRRTLQIRRTWEDIISGAVPAESWRFDPLNRDIVETILLDRLDVAPPDETERLLECLRSSALLDARIHEARHWRGWRRRQALLSLGRMRAPEGIPSVSEALDDLSQETRIAAVRGLGRIGLPKAAEPILERLIHDQLSVPVPVLQNALLSCYRAHPNRLLPYVCQAGDRVRPLLARVLSEVATPELGEDLLLLCSDPLGEVRASAARALAQAKPDLALSALADLAADEEWFVRLRAVAALGEFRDPRTIPVLIETLCDRNRQVRRRSAATLAQLKGHEEEVLSIASQMHDRYGLQVLVSELQRSGGFLRLVNALRDPGRRPRAGSALLIALRSGSHRALLEQLVYHGDWRTRGALARLLARYGDTSLLVPLERLAATLAPSRQRRVLHWLIQQLRSKAATESSQERVLT